MKSRFYRKSRRSAFTLVELLVVIGIIAILAGVITISVGAAMNAAKRAKAGVLAAQVDASCMNYYAEYGVYPIPLGANGAGGDLFIDEKNGNQWQLLTWGLCGNINPAKTSDGSANSAATGINNRNVQYLQFSKGDVDANGALKNPMPPNGSADQLYFNIVLDTDYSGIAGDGASPAAGKIPDFGTSKGATINYLNGGQGVPKGVAIWANCNTGTTTNASYYVHTF